MKDFLFRKHDEAQPTPVAPEAPKAPEAPVTPVAPVTLAIPVAEAETPEAPAPEEVSMTYLLERLEAIQKDGSYIREALDKIAGMDDGDQALAMANIVEARENTNQDLIAVYTNLLNRKNLPKMPNLEGWADGLGKKWNELKDKAKTTVETTFTSEQDAEIKRQIDEAAQDIHDATRNVDETIRRSIDKAVEVLRQAARGTREAYNNWTASVRQEETPESGKKSGSTLDMVTELLRDPNLSIEEKELIFAYIEEIRDVDEVTQAKMLEILRDGTLSLEEKEMILKHIEDLQELS